MQRTGQNRNMYWCTLVTCAQRSIRSLQLIGQSAMCSEPLEKLGEVPGAAQVPQHVVEEADCVQNLGWSDCSK